VQPRQPAISIDDSDEAFKKMPEVIQRVLLNRNICRYEETQASLKDLLSPDGFKDMPQAARRIAQAIESQQAILIVGDYDADGATATALGIRGLGMLGAQQVGYKVPNRFKDGYGLTLKLAQKIIRAAQTPQLVLTVDNGISSVEGVECLNQAGIDVIVTDHHLAGEQLPDALAIVNPNQPGCEFASKAIAGVGVMFYVLLAVRAYLREQKYFGSNPQPNLAVLLDLVAVGTVADVVALDRNNRILVANGIARMRSGRISAGLGTILEVAQADPAHLVAHNLGFVVGPRLNAAGRLEDISSGIECLLADDQMHALALARKLDQINRDRKEIEQSMQQQALTAVKQLDIQRGGEPLKQGLVLFDEAWHEGVVGLVASRIKDRTGVPVLVLASGEDDMLKGSARSVPEVHIRDVLANIDARHPGMIMRFGGHAMAAGLSLDCDQLDGFRAAFSQEVAEALAKRPPANTLLTDGALSTEQFTRGFAADLQSLLPWGQACPEPMFEGEFEILNSRFVGEIHLKLVLRLPGERLPIDAICFRYLENGDAPEKRKALEMQRTRAVFSLDVNRFRGRESLQLLIRYMEVLD